MSMSRVLALSILLSVAASAPAQQAGKPVEAASPQSVTVPLVVELNRPFVDLEFSRPDGTTRTARF